MVACEHTRVHVCMMGLSLKLLEEPYLSDLRMSDEDLKRAKMPDASGWLIGSEVLQSFHFESA